MEARSLYRPLFRTVVDHGLLRAARAAGRLNDESYETQGFSSLDGRQRIGVVVRRDMVRLPGRPKRPITPSLRRQETFAGSDDCGRIAARVEFRPVHGSSVGAV